MGEVGVVVNWSVLIIETFFCCYTFTDKIAFVKVQKGINKEKDLVGGKCLFGYAKTGGSNWIPVTFILLNVFLSFYFVFPFPHISENSK